MYGLMLSLIVIMALSAVKITYDYTANTDGPSQTMSSTDDIESGAESIAGSIQMAMADATASCVEHSKTTTSASCITNAPNDVAIVPNGWGMVTQFPIYQNGTVLGKIDTFYGLGSNTGIKVEYLMAVWLPASARVAATYCETTMNALERDTDDSNWVASYNPTTLGVNIYQADTTGSTPTSYQISSTALTAAVAKYLTPSCPVFIEPIDQQP